LRDFFPIILPIRRKMGEIKEEEEYKEEKKDYLIT